MDESANAKALLRDMAQPGLPHLVNPGLACSTLQPGMQLVQGLCRTRGNHLDSSVVQVARQAVQTQCARLISRTSAEPDALDAA